jgi:PPOX class probable F420-dependent enzyme
VAERIAQLRAIETRLYSHLRHRDAAVRDGDAFVAWDPRPLAGHKYGALVTYRRDGTPVATPMWIGPAAGSVYVRSAASDGKIKRIRRNPSVLLAACTPRGKPLGPWMRGTARILDASEEPRAEAALRANVGVERRIYRFVRQPWLDAAYIEITGGAESPAGSDGPVDMVI